jgi:putative transposase
MSWIRKLSQTIWHFQYHIVWVPKHRYQVLKGPIGSEFETCIHVFSDQQLCEIFELNVCELILFIYWGNQLWSRGYCVNTVGLDTEMAAKYFRHQEQKKRESEKPKH